MLQLKSLGIDKLLGFPFPTPPDVDSVKAAIKVSLFNLSSLSSFSQIYLFRPSPTYRHWTNNSKLPAWERLWLLFPLLPDLEKCTLPIATRLLTFVFRIVLARQSECLTHVIALVAALSVYDPLLREKYATELDEKEKENDKDESEDTAKQRLKGIFQQKGIVITAFE